MRFLRRSLVGLFLMSLTLGLLSWAGQTLYSALQVRWNQQAPDRPQRERVFAANVITVEPSRLSPILETYGEVRSQRTLDLRATASGAIIELAPAFQEGGSVEVGQVLVRIDPRAAESALAAARSDLREADGELADAERGLALAGDDLASAQAQLELRQQALTRQEGLASRGLGTEAATETAKLALSAAEQSVLSRRQALANAQARLDLARTTLERRGLAHSDAERALADTVITAEFSGILAGVTAVKGAILSNNEALAQLIDPTALEIGFRISTAQYNRLLDADGKLTRAGITAALDVFGIGLTTTGRITRESAVVGEGQTGRELFAEIDAAAGFRPGDFVTIRIEEPPLDDVALIPATALDSNSVALALGADDRLTAVPVTVARRQGDDVVIVVGELAGRELVAERTPLLGAGIRIRPLRAGAQEEQQAAAGAPAAPATQGAIGEAEGEMITLTEERRAKLVDFVTANQNMPADAKERILTQLQQPQVSEQMVTRIESRMGG